MPLMFTKFLFFSISIGIFCLPLTSWHPLDVMLFSASTAFTAAAMWLHHNEQALGDGVEAAWGALTRRLRFVCMTPLFLVDVVMRVRQNTLNRLSSSCPITEPGCACPRAYIPLYMPYCELACCALLIPCQPTQLRLHKNEVSSGCGLVA